MADSTEPTETIITFERVNKWYGDAFHVLRDIDLTVRRQVGMVFRPFNLFPHLTVLQNLTLAPLQVSREPRRDAEARAMAQLERVHIVEQAPPAEFFNAPRNERTRAFLDQVLAH